MGFRAKRWRKNVVAHFRLPAVATNSDCDGGLDGVKQVHCINHLSAVFSEGFVMRAMNIIANIDLYL